MYKVSLRGVLNQSESICEKIASKFQGGGLIIYYFYFFALVFIKIIFF